jgi:hypothetical protein
MLINDFSYGAKGKKINNRHSINSHNTTPAFLKNLLLLAALLTVTIAKAESPPSRDIVRDTQLLLFLKGLYTGPISGIAGPETRHASFLYQKGWPQTEGISYLYRQLREETRLALAQTEKDHVNVERTEIVTPRDPIDPLVSPQDKDDNLNTGAVAAAIAAIEAARHSVEENKDFYEGNIRTILWAAGILSLLISAGGITFLREYAKRIAIERAEEALKTINKEIESVKDDLYEYTKKLEEHLKERDKFHKNMKKFQEETTQNNNAFYIFIPPYIELMAWIRVHGRKSTSTRPATSHINSALDACDKAIKLKITDKYLL